MSTEDVHRSEDSCLAKRVARRWTVLQVLGVLLMLVACAVEWAPPDDPALPPTRPFLLMIGVLIFVSGRVIRREWSQNHSDLKPGQLVTGPPPGGQGSHGGGSKEKPVSSLSCHKQIRRVFIRS